VDVTLLTAVIYPFVFALVEALAGRLADPHPRQGERRFRITFLRGEATYETYPFDMSQLQEELRDRRDILDIEVMPPGLCETNIGIELCVGAIAINIVNVLVILLSPDVVRTLPLRIAAVSTFAVELVLLLAIAYVLRVWSGHRERWVRIVVAQVSNLLGVALLMSQFLVFGRALGP
jgi:hypothetical protein